MSTFGCHSCGVDLSKYTSYMDTPCATCKMQKEYYNTPKAPFYDSAGADDSETAVDDNFLVEPDFGEEDEEPQLSLEESVSLKTIREIVQKQTLLLLSDSIMRLLRMAKSNPVMFEVVIKKMQFPYMSYAEIGNSMTPAITKQNVLYHLKHAIEAFPELGAVFLTDTRFSAGKNALETVSNKVRRNVAKDKLCGILYGDDSRMKAMAMKEINAILRAPFMVEDSVLDFRYYGDDEAALRLERERARNLERLENGEQLDDQCES